MRILVVNQYFHPDRSATAQLLTELCEDLSHRHEVQVIAGAPSYNVAQSDGGWTPPRSLRVSHAWSTSFHRSLMPGRISNYATYLSSSLASAMAAKRPDVVLAWTDPPVIGLNAAIAARWRGVPFVLGTQDIFPEVAIRLGRLHNPALIAGLRFGSRFQQRSATRVISLGRDMTQRLRDLGVPEPKIRTICNWADGSVVRPLDASRLRSEWRLEDRFVVMHSGNVGLSQQLDVLLDAADKLRSERDVVFAIVGDGALKALLQRDAERRRLENVQFLPFQVKASLSESLGAADVHVIGLQAGLEGFIVPSKLYGIMAAGKPFIAATAEEAEPALVAREHGCGTHVPPGDPAALAAAILNMKQADRKAMGRRARDAFVGAYDRKIATSAYERALIDAVKEYQTA